MSQVGAPIPICFGTQLVGGTVIWASPIREEASTTTAGGKGGPEQQQTTFRYFRSWAVLLCEGPIAGVRRVWFNGKKVVNNASIPGMDLDAALANIRSPNGMALMGQQIQSSIIRSKMTVYLGTEDQMPDPTMESFLGVGNVPAYRGYAYVVFDDVELKPEDGNRMPAAMKFEVYEDGDSTVFPLDLYSNEVLYSWVRGDDPTNPLNLNFVESWTNPAASGIGEVYDTVNQVMGNVVNPHRGYALPYAIGQTNGTSLGQDGLMDTYGGNSLADGVWAYISFNSLRPTQIYLPGEEPLCGEGAWETPGVVWSFSGDGIRLTSDIEYSAGVTPSVNPPFDSVDACPGSFYVFNSSETVIRIRRAPGPPRDPCLGLTQFPIPGWGITERGELAQCGSWTRENGAWLAMQVFTEVSPLEVKYPLNPILPSTHPSNTQAFWESAYAEHVARGTMPAGLTYGVHYPVFQAFGYRKDFNGEWIDTLPVSLASIVSRLCERVGLTSYDVTDLEDRYVVGYTIGRQMLCRAAIEPLKSIGFFDSVESGIALKFPVRGKASVATIESDELGARFSQDSRPSQLITTKKQEYELPMLIRVHYQNPQRDFDPGEELSPIRFDTQADSVIDIDIAAAVTSDQAAQIAEVLYRDAWASRWQHQTQLDVTRSNLEPTDAIVVTVDGRLQRMRIPSITERDINLRALELVRDDDGSYVSTAVGSVVPDGTVEEIELFGPLQLMLLDLPALSDSDDDAGFYAAIRPLLQNGAFRGGTVQRSRDGGGSYETVASITRASPSGVVWLPAGEGPSTVFDEMTEVRVELLYGSLDSRDEIDVLNGANAAAIGVHGRWEIIQFKNAELIAGNVWSLTGLLRGRRGTEHNIGTGEIGDTFVLLSDDNVARVTQQVSDIDATYLYKGFPIGSAPTAEPIEFAGDGEALKPFSPVHIEGEQDEATNAWSITWVRRDRLGDDVNVSMSEDVEDYEVEILNSSNDVLRTISTSTQSATYTSSQQITDFGSVQNSLSIRVYQKSVQVGRGYPGSATL